ncbi:hypothetical protein Patl1_15144 [Pistacia atlantica]|uniref:Uncharacterized protein n=1 Tax=Pistacia atlantica TaxID=434234 RepID=A0ACC1B932_9ROSI|nr:hypothetical protein Patl1_15144 [Pistacia atlantica]
MLLLQRMKLKIEASPGNRYWNRSFNSRFTSADPSSNLEFQLGSACLGVLIFSYTELAEAINNFSVSC